MREAAINSRTAVLAGRLWADAHRCASFLAFSMRSEVSPSELESVIARGTHVSKGVTRDMLR